MTVELAGFASHDKHVQKSVREALQLRGAWSHLGLNRFHPKMRRSRAWLARFRKWCMHIAVTLPDLGMLKRADFDNAADRKRPQPVFGSLS